MTYVAFFNETDEPATTNHLFCNKCDRPLSFANGVYWCRACHPTIKTKKQHWLKRFWQKHIAPPFPCPEKCWPCNRESCVGCEVFDDRS